MKALGYGVLVVGVAIAGFGVAQSAKGRGTMDHGDREKLIGAWRLVHIDAPGPDGRQANLAGDAAQPKGMLIYTRDGHMSVQLMYPKSAEPHSNEYVRDGYEASFGSYKIDETRHILTHHVEGSITGGMLVGKDLPRTYRFTSDGKLVLGPAGSEEHWSVTWEHY